MTTTPPPSTGVLCTLLLPEGGPGAIQVDDIFDTDIDDLWSALTEPDRLARWMGTFEGDLRPHGTFQVRFRSGRECPGRIDVCDPPHRLVITVDPGTPDESAMEAVLTPVGEQTRLFIEDRGLALDDAPAHAAGWQAHIEDLIVHIAGGEPNDWHARWDELDPLYEQLAQDVRSR